jgi:hypothetical protein
MFNVKPSDPADGNTSLKVERAPSLRPRTYRPHSWFGWLTGLAGLGKTTIAYTICKMLHEDRLPFASFFCSLQLDSRNSKLLCAVTLRNCTPPTLPML